MLNHPLITYITEHGEFSDRVKNLVPDAYVSNSLSNRASVKHEQLARVQSHLQHVVDDGEQGSQRERRHEDGHEAELNHCRQQW